MTLPKQLLSRIIVYTDSGRCENIHVRSMVDVIKPIPVKPIKPMKPKESKKKEQ